MKRIILTLSIILVYLCTFAQGIHFEKSYESALAKAKKWERGVFIDVMTSWCGPCKQMEKNVFTDNEVANYFNRNYVSLKIDAEKGEGPMIAKKYGVKSYPTLIFLDKDGNFVHKVTGGLNANRLIHEAKQSTSPEAKKLRTLAEKYKSGDMNESEILDYLKLLKQVELDYSTVFSEYFKGLSEKEKQSLDTYNLMNKYISRHDDFPFEYLVNHYKKYRKIVDETQLIRYMYHNLTFATYTNERENKSNALMYQKLKDAKIPFLPYVKENYTLVKMLKDETKHPEIIKRAKVMFKECPQSYSVFLNEAVKQAVGSQLMEDFCVESINNFAKINKEGAGRSCNSFAYLFLLNGRDAEKALKYYKLSKSIYPEGITGYAKSNMEYCQRSLGLIKCENYGETAPLFTLNDIDGKEISLDKLKGKYVLIDFWASWCGPCIGEIKYLKEAYQKYGKKNVVFLSISVDKDETAWKTAVEKHNLTWHQLRDTEKVADDYKVSGIPRILLINKEGKIIGDNLREGAMERELKKVL